MTLPPARGSTVCGILGDVTRFVHRILVLAALVSVGASTVTTTGGVEAQVSTGERATNPFIDLLDTVPASLVHTDGSLLTYVDMDLIWAGAGVSTDHDERVDSRELGTLPLRLAPQFMIRGGLTEPDELRGEIGFDGFDVARTLEAGARPGNALIIQTSVPATTVIDAMRADPVWSPDLQEIESSVGEYFQWTDDPPATDFDRLTILHPLGQGGALSIVAGDPTTIVLATDPGVVTDALSTTAGDAPSAADDPNLGPALGIIGDHDITQAVVQSDLGDARSVLVIAQLSDRGGGHTEILVVYPDADAADADAGVIEDYLRTAISPNRWPIAELLAGATVEADGRVVRIVVPGIDSFRPAFDLLLLDGLLP